jgi:hypothetical protein
MLAPARAGALGNRNGLAGFLMTFRPFPDAGALPWAAKGLRAFPGAAWTLSLYLFRSC